MNQDLNQLHDLLTAQHAALYQLLATAPDSDTMAAIITEMRELRHRIDLTQGLLLSQSSQQLSGLLANVTKADADLTKALGAVATATNVIQGVGKFLTFVDQALDFAKTLALA